MDKIKQNSRWLYALVFVVSILPLLRFTDHIEVVYTVKVLVVQVMALLGSYLMFTTLSQNPVAAFLCVTLYMTSPYRIDLCYVQNDLRMSAAWALLPLYLFGVLKGKDEEKGIRKVAYVVLAALSLAGSGYGSSVIFCVVVMLTLLMAAVFRCGSAVVALAGGALLWLPGNVEFLLYIFTDRATQIQTTVQNITPKGYVFSDFLTSYTYLQGKPGLGLGLLLALALYAYVRFVNGEAKQSREAKLLGVIGVLALIFSTRYFPWELVQRVGAWALKFVSMIETPALFMGFATLLLPVIVMPAVDTLEKAEEKIPARGSLIIVWTAAMGIGVYLCSVLV